MQAEDRGLTHVLTTTFPTAKAFEAKRRTSHRRLNGLIDKAGGRLRSDCVHQNLVLMLMANAGVVAATADVLPDAWRRPVAYRLQAFAAENASRLPAPPSGARLFRAMVRLGPDDCR